MTTNRDQAGAELVAALTALANAADEVGVKFFDTDTMDPLVKTMQTATERARALVAQHDERVRNLK